MEALTRSGFYQVEECTNPNSAAVKWATVVYEHIRARRHQDALNSFRLALDNVLPEISG